MDRLQELWWVRPVLRDIRVMPEPPANSGAVHASEKREETREAGRARGGWDDWNDRPASHSEARAQQPLELLDSSDDFPISQGSCGVDR